MKQTTEQKVSLLFSVNSTYIQFDEQSPDMSWWAWTFLCLIPTFYICSSKLTVRPSLCPANPTVKVIISQWYKSKCSFSWKITQRLKKLCATE